MSYFAAIILGLVQGLTEFLPISSSAHLRVVGDLWGGTDPGAAFTAVVQLGTELAVLVYFWRDIVDIVSRWFRALPMVREGKRIPQSDPQVRLGWMIIVGSLPIVILGVLLENKIDTSFRNLWLIALMLLGFGLILGWADSIGKMQVELEQMKWGQAVIYGFAQALALIPGVSRSGGTITAGLLMGFTRQAAARYSFLLAMPAVFGSGFYKLVKTWGESDLPAGPTAVATVVSFVVGYAVIVGFLKLISNHSFKIFVWYRVLFAMVIVFLLLAGLLPPVPGLCAAGA